MRVIPVITGALGTVSKGFYTGLELVSPNIYFRTLYKVCLLGAARILR